MRIEASGTIAACWILVWAADVSGQKVGVGIPASAHCNRGIELLAKKDLDRAIAEFNEAIRIDPSSTRAYCGRALAWFEKQEFDKAIADNGEAIRIDPKHSRSYNNRGNSWVAKREFARAIADYSEAIRLDPNYAEAYKNRAWIWAACPSELVRDGKRAIESATRGCELTDWKEPIYLDTLAASYAEAGDFDAAATTQARAIDLTRDLGARLTLYRNKQKHRGDAELNVRLSQARPAAFSSDEKSRAFFIVPYDAVLSLTPAGGIAGAVTEFGLGTSEASHTPVFTGLPGNPEPNREVKIGFVAAGSELSFYEKTVLSGRRLRLCGQSEQPVRGGLNFRRGGPGS